MNCFSETHLVQKLPTLTVSYLKVDLRIQPFHLSRFIIHPENPTTAHLKNLNLLKLSKDKNVIIQKSDKGNSVVLIDKIVYTNGIKKLLDNPKQFEKLSIDPNKELNFILNCGQKVIDILKEIKNKNQIKKDLYNKLRPVGSQLGVLFDLAKVHKKVIHDCLDF